MKGFKERALARLKSEEGFTLIELMVVVMIIGQLLLLSIPTFIGTKNRAMDAAAKSGAVRAIQTGRIVYTDTVSYTSASTSALTTAEPSMTFNNATTASTGSKVASTDNSAPQVFTVAVWSTSGTCFYAKDQALVGVSYGKVTGGTQANCTASNVPGTLTGW